MQAEQQQNIVSSSAFPVSVNVYGLTELNEKLRNQKLRVGIYHVGIEVHGIEWSYGYHRYPISGIYSLHKPRDLRSLSKDDNMFYISEQIIIGNTQYTLKQISNHLTELGLANWTGLKYHILYKNSAEFANKFCIYLCGKELPHWINCFAKINQKHSHFIHEIPEEFRTPIALKEIIEQKISFAHQNKKMAKNKSMIAKVTQPKWNVFTTKSDLCKNIQTQTSATPSTAIAPKETSQFDPLSSVKASSEEWGDFLDSKILAAPSLDDFRSELEKNEKQANNWTIERK